jgi:hypothetical protein
MNVTTMKLGSSVHSLIANELLTLASGHGMMQTSNGLATYERAMMFLESLPAEFKPPELSVDPDGEIAFDWMAGDDVFSVSLNASGQISYAAEIGGKLSSGPAFFGGILPEEILAMLRCRGFSRACSPRWLA